VSSVLGQDWQAALARIGGGRVAIMCVGNVLCGDDGAGPALAERLHVGESWGVFDCAVAPENWIGPVCSFRPDLVIAVDSAHFDAPPGAIACWEREALAHLSASTHRASLSMVLEVIEQETGAPSLILGIQPQSAALGARMSPAVEAAVCKLAEGLTRHHLRSAGEASRP